MPAMAFQQPGGLEDWLLFKAASCGDQPLPARMGQAWVWSPPPTGTRPLQLARSNAAASEEERRVRLRLQCEGGAQPPKPRGLE